MARSFIPQDLYEVIFNRVPRLCVDLVIKDDAGRLLLTRRDIQPYRNLWHLPGGGVRFKETIAEAATRISQKEFGVSVEVVRTIGACETMNDDLDEGKIPRHSVSVVVEVRITAGIPTQGAETSGVEYFGELPAEMHPYHGPFIRGHHLL